MATLNPNIPLSVQQFSAPQLVNNLAALGQRKRENKLLDMKTQQAQQAGQQTALAQKLGFAALHGDKDALNALAAVDPSRAKAIGDIQRAQLQQRVQDTARAAAYVLKSPNPEQAWHTARTQFMQKYPDAQIPEQYDPQWLHMEVAQAQKVGDILNPPQPQLTAVYDPNSPTGARYVTRNQAVGRYGPQKGSGTTVNVNTGGGIGPASAAATKKFGAGIGDRASKRVAAAQNAQHQNILLNRMRQAINAGAKTGLGQSQLLDLKNIGQSLFGLKFGPQVGQQEIIRKISNQMALRLRNPASGLGLTGNTSNKDLQFLKDSVPGLSRTPQGMRMMIDMGLKVGKLKIDAAQYQAKLIQANGGIVPANLDQKMLEYVNNYELLDADEKAKIKQLKANNGFAASYTFTGPDGKSITTSIDALRKAAKVRGVALGKFIKTLNAQPSK